jgi:hypothetical protein
VQTLSVHAGVLGCGISTVRCGSASTLLIGTNAVVWHGTKYVRNLDYTGVMSASAFTAVAALSNWTPWVLCVWQYPASLPVNLCLV